MSIFLAPISYAKKSSFDMQPCDRLINGDGPDAVSAGSSSSANTTASSSSAAPTSSSVQAPMGPATLKVTPADFDAAAAEATSSTNKSEASADGKNILEPVKLTDEQSTYSVGKDGKVKLKASKNVKKDKDKDNGPDKFVKEAKKVNITPLALLESDAESQQKAEVVADAEKAQLTDLWSATINRSPDIQFVIQRMQPHSDPNHATSTVLKLLGGALFSAAQAGCMFMGPSMGMGNMASYAMMGGANAGGSMMQSLLNVGNSKNAKKQQISQEQATMLYKMVRDTADKLVANFRLYKKYRAQYESASDDYEYIKKLVADESNNADTAKRIDMEYTIRKAKREMDGIIDEAKVQRQALSDLAGQDAVAKLDDQIDEEIANLKSMTGNMAGKVNPDDVAVQKAPEASPTLIAPLNGAVTK